MQKNTSFGNKVFLRHKNNISIKLDVSFLVYFFS